jgi:hypothetical protein
MVNDKPVNAAVCLKRPIGAEKEKRAAIAGGSKFNREASNRVDRSHSMSNKIGRTSNEGESLISP